MISMHLKRFTLEICITFLILIHINSYQSISNYNLYTIYLLTICETFTVYHCLFFLDNSVTEPSGFNMDILFKVPLKLFLTA